MTTNEHHYFASSVLSWGVGDTLEQAIDNMVKAARRDIAGAIQNCHKNAEPGWYFWACRVDAPRTQQYSIEFYMPKGVDISHMTHGRITYLTQKKLAYFTSEQDVPLYNVPAER